MKTRNHSYYMSLSSTGLLFANTDPKEEQIYTIQELNKLGLRFIMAIKMRSATTELDHIVAIFELPGE